MTASEYERFAEAYSAENESSLHNAYYERPGMVHLAGDVSGRRILDAGCGSGPLSAVLRAKGASSPASTQVRPWSTWPASAGSGSRFDPFGA